jgi:hypothetical protein
MFRPNENSRDSVAFMTTIGRAIRLFGADSAFAEARRRADVLAAYALGASMTTLNRRESQARRRPRSPCPVLAHDAQKKSAAIEIAAPDPPRESGEA